LLAKPKGESIFDHQYDRKMLYQAHRDAGPNQTKKRRLFTLEPDDFRSNREAIRSEAIRSKV
jgi:hypothetical protein